MRATLILVLFAACGFEVRGSGVGPTIDDAGPEDDAATVSDPDGGSVLPSDAGPIDAPLDTPTSTACGSVGEMCCADPNQPACDGGGECTSGTCTACGGLFQSCCDPGASCGALDICLGGTCASPI